MTKQEKIKCLVELAGLDEKLRALVYALGQHGDNNDAEFLKFLYDKIVSAHTSIFEEKLKEEQVDKLIWFFSNTNLLELLKLLDSLSAEALHKLEPEIEKYIKKHIEEEGLEDYVQHEADKGEVN